jgi:hypothetical protein
MIPHQHPVCTSIPPSLQAVFHDFTTLSFLTRIKNPEVPHYAIYTRMPLLHVSFSLSPACLPQHLIPEHPQLRYLSKLFRRQVVSQLLSCDTV